MSKEMKIIIYSLIGIGTILLFVNIPDYQSERAVKKILDFGHIIYFFLVVLILMKNFRWIKSLTKNRQLITIFIITFVLSIMIEGTQLFTNRTADLGDIKRNFIGSTTAIFFLWKADDKIKYFLISIRVFIFLILLSEISPIMKAITDESIAKIQFPVLSDFETPFEIERWGGESEYNISQEYARSGKKSLKIETTLVRYSGIWLKYFPRDWSRYKNLTFSLYNNGNKNLTLYFRINDEEHTLTGEEYTDRFNIRLNLNPGWNDIVLSLCDIQNAPKTRKMDLSNIIGFGFFVGKENESKIFYIDNVKLS